MLPHPIHALPSPPLLQPDPRQLPPSSIYNFPTWSRQLRAFIADVVGEPAALVCNSVGGLAGLQVTAACRPPCSEAPFCGFMRLLVSLLRQREPQHAGCCSASACLFRPSLARLQRPCRADSLPLLPGPAPGCALQAALDDPSLVRGVQVMNISLRMLVSRCCRELQHCSSVGTAALHAWSGAPCRAGLEAAVDGAWRCRFCFGACMRWTSTPVSPRPQASAAAPPTSAAQHVSKEPEWQRPLVKALQDTLRTTPLGAWFFSQIANRQVRGRADGWWAGRLLSRGRGSRQGLLQWPAASPASLPGWQWAVEDGGN